MRLLAAASQTFLPVWLIAGLFPMELAAFTPTHRNASAQSPTTKAGDQGSKKSEGHESAYAQFPVERELKGGETHTYRMLLKANDFLSLVVEQKGIDVVVRLVGPDGKQLVEVDSPNGTKGPEPLSWIPTLPGDYRLEIASLDKNAAPGRYEVKIIEQRVATPKDQDLLEAKRLADKVEKLFAAGRYDEAIPLAEKSLALREKNLGSEDPEVGRTLNNLGVLYYVKDDYAKAGPLIQRASTILEKALGSEHPEVADPLFTLALLAYKKGDFTKAELLDVRVLAIKEKAFGADHPEVAPTLNNLADVYRAQAKYAKAESLYQRALTINEKTYGPEHPEVGISLNNLAVLYRNKGDYAGAVPLLQRALAIREKARGAEHPDVALSLNNLALIYQNLGDYGKAEPLYQRSLAIYEKTRGAEHPDVARQLNNLGTLYKDKGDYSKVEPLYLRALAIYEKMRGAEHPDVGMALSNLGLLYKIQGDLTKAESLFERSLSIYEKYFGPEHPEVAISLSNLASLYHDQGNYTKAEHLYERDLAIREKALGPEHSDVAFSLNHLALLYHDQGDYLKAERLNLRALAIWEKTRGLEHPLTAVSLLNLAVMYAARGDLKQAISYQARLGECRENDWKRNLVTGSERQKLAYLKQSASDLDTALTLQLQLAPDDPDARHLALTMVLRRKGRALDAMTDAIAGLRRRAGSEDQKLLDELADTRSQLSRLTLKGSGREGVDQHRATLKQLEESVEQLETRISRRSVEFRVQNTPITLEAVQQKIPQQAALVEFVVYRPFDAKTRKYDQPHYAVYVLKSDGPPLAAELGATKTIDEGVARLREVLRNRKSSLSRQVKPAARALDKLVMQPVRKLLGPAKQLLISPDGALNLIPFDTLTDERGQFLVVNYEISYLTSGRDLLRLRNGILYRTRPVVVADPDYALGKGPQLFDQSFKPLASLPGTSVEAASIQKEFPSALVKLKAEATKQAVKSIAGPQFLHIATHGYFLEDEPPIPNNDELAQRNLTKMEDASKALPPGTKLGNPLLRSGLFLAGANSVGRGDDDGVLTAFEAGGLDLWGTKLVVLSACDTGLGDVKNGEGVYGLRRALVLAGAESQLMSLWPVSDQGTRELMTRYYQALKAGEGRSPALRKIRLEFLKNTQRRHPYYWAGFILSGEWGKF